MSTRTAGRRSRSNVFTLRAVITPLLIGALGWFCAEVSRADVAQVDAYFLAPGSPESYGIAISAGQSLGQTFTVQRTGWLTEFDLQVGRISEAVIQPLHIELRKTNLGTPDLSANGLLYSTTLDATLFPVGMPFNFSVAVNLGDGIQVKSGDRLGILCSTTSSDWYYWTSWKLADLYPGGSTYWKPSSRTYYTMLSGQDSGFQTWVVPEPSGLLPLGLAALAFARFRSNRPVLSD